MDNSYSNYCLFIALELTRLYIMAHVRGDTYEKKKARELAQGATPYWEAQRLNLALDLIRQVNRTGFGQIRLNMPEYSLSECLPMVERYYHWAYPDFKLRLLAYDEYGSTRPLYKSQVRADHDLCIWRDGHHFHGIKNINTFFSKERFCVDCERTYDRPKTHSIKCKAKCMLCCGIGCGGFTDTVCFSIDTLLGHRFSFAAHYHSAPSLFPTYFDSFAPRAPLPSITCRSTWSFFPCSRY